MPIAGGFVIKRACASKSLTIPADVTAPSNVSITELAAADYSCLDEGSKDNFTLTIMKDVFITQKMMFQIIVVNPTYVSTNVDLSVYGYSRFAAFKSSGYLYEYNVKTGFLGTVTKTTWLI